MCQNKSPCSEDKCSKRHPKTRNGYCRHKEICAYKHREDAQSQDTLKKAMLMLMLRQHKEIAASTEKSKESRDNCSENQTENNENLNQLEKIPNQETDKDKHNQEEEVFEPMYNCTMCSYNCASKMILKKHIELKQKHQIMEQVGIPKVFCQLS